MFAGTTATYLRGLGSALLIAILLLPGPVTAQKLQRDRDMSRLSLQDLRAELAVAVRRFRSLRDRANSIQASMDKTELAVRGLAKRMLELEKSTDAVARTLYKGGSTVGLQGLLGAQNVSDAEMRLKYLESSGQVRTSIFERLAADRAELEKKLDLLDAARTEANAARNRIARLQDEIATKIKLKQKELAAIDAKLARQASAVAVERVTVLRPAPVPKGPYSVNWDAIAMCESGGNWQLDSTYDGGLQFHPNTWLAYGGGRYARYAWQATREQQIAIAERVLAGQGPSAWPHCFKYGT